MSVSVKQVLDTLLSIGVIASTEIKQPIKPWHGPCCTCQTCGHAYDECVCDDNEVIAALLKLEEDSQ